MKIATLALIAQLLAAPAFAQEDCKAYLFARMGRAEGQPANDWAAVLESLPRQGFGVNPQPGQIQPANAPHHGITVMIDAGGHARGRVWLATDFPTVDGNGNQWFTHEYQVIADGPAPGSFVWAWQDKGGGPPRACRSVTPEPGPVPPVTPPPPTTPTVPDELLEAIATLRELQKAIDLLRGDLDAMKNRPFPCFGGRLGGAVPVTLCPK